LRPGTASLVWFLTKRPPQRVLDVIDGRTASQVPALQACLEEFQRAAENDHPTSLGDELT
jgi:hypothetical protein